MACRTDSTWQAGAPSLQVPPRTCPDRLYNAGIQIGRIGTQAVTIIGRDLIQKSPTSAVKTDDA